MQELHRLNEFFSPKLHPCGFQVEGFQPMETTLDAGTHYLRKTFPIFLQHRSLHLHRRMDLSEKSCVFCPLLCLSQFSTDFNHRSSFLSFRYCTIFINLIFSCCSSLVLSRVAHFTFLMMLC